MPITIVAINGSLRKTSIHQHLLQAAIDHAPDGVNIIQASIKLPLYNQDDEKQPPQEVVEFHNLLQQADGFLIGCPENNYSVTAALKNAIVSR